MATRGASLRISGLSISFPLDGGTGSVSEPKVELAFCMSLYWLEIALRHLLAAKAYHEAIVAARDEKHWPSDAIEGEMCSAMQAIVAAATAADALYATVKPHLALPKQTLEAWRKGRTPRYKQVVEVFRLCWKLRPNQAETLRQALREIYKYRDWAVHPGGEFAVPHMHPVLPASFEWRVIAFRFDNALQIVRFVLGTVDELARHNVESHGDVLSKILGGLSTNLKKGAVALWKESFGSLYAAPEGSGGTGPASRESAGLR